VLAAGWAWTLTTWLTDLFDPRSPIIEALVVVTAGAVVMAEALRGRGLAFVLAFFAMNLAREAVLIPGTRVNPDIQARTIPVFFWPRSPSRQRSTASLLARLAKLPWLGRPGA
jgi:low temperature requirement protein LtrA